METYTTGHGLDHDVNKNGVRLAICECGATIHQRTPNRRQPNISLEDFIREAQAKHQLHIEYIRQKHVLRIAAKSILEKNLEAVQDELKNPIYPRQMNETYNGSITGHDPNGEQY